MLIFILIAAYIRVVGSSATSGEIQALKALYDATDGANWKYPLSGKAWSFSSVPASQDDPCVSSWEGVGCGSGNVAVTSLDVTAMGLVGTLPEEIGALTSLTKLDVTDTSLSGAIPGGLFLLTKLQYCQLGNNYFSGPLSPSINRLKTLTYLSLYGNSLTGSIPSELFELTALQTLGLDSNQFEGTLSSAVGQLTALTGFALNSNSLSGSLPVELFELTALQVLALYSNKFEGTLSPAVGQLTALNEIYLHDNSLSGSLPVELFELTNLEKLMLSKNRLTGTLSSSINNLSKLARLDLDINSMEGTIPRELFELTDLQSLKLGSNRFGGSLSSSIAQLALLTGLFLESNSLEGKLPKAIFTLTNLEYLKLSGNQFTSSLDSSIGRLTAMKQLFLDDNSFSALLPRALFYLTRLEDLRLSSNKFSGSLPSSPIKYLTRLTTFNVFQNSMSGSLPRELFELTALIELKIYLNAFSGNLPIVDASLRIQTMDLSNNALTGSPPLWISSMPNLTSLSLANNSFSSTTLDFLPSQNIESLDISGNALGGTLPDKIFQSSPRLRMFVAASNCLSGSVPAAICEATTLQILILDGLSSGKSCTEPIFQSLVPSWRPGTLTKTKIKGRLPACLFSSLPNVTILHVSGNGLLGSLPSTLSRWPQSLSDLSISTNRLTGPIPGKLQSAISQFKVFDVSNNFLGGTLDSVVLGDGTDANFVVNRFSGLLSNAIVAASHIRVLEGNLFACSSFHKDTQLPAKDPYLDRFSCGSNTFDENFVAFFVVILVVATATTLVLYLPKRQWPNIGLLLDPPIGATRGDAINSLNIALQRIRRLCAYYAVVLLAVLIPVYAGVSAHYGTHSSTGSWSVSAGFVRGVVPAAVFLAVWVVLLVMSAFALMSQSWPKSPLLSARERETAQQSLQGGGQEGMKKEVEVEASALKMAAAQFLVFVANAVFMIVANVGYVTVVSTSNSDSQNAANIALTLFQLLWESAALPRLIKSAKRCSDPKGESPLLRLKLSLAAFNIVLAPAIAVVITDSRCFAQAFVAPPPVTSSYTFLQSSDIVRTGYADATTGAFVEISRKKINEIYARAYVSFDPSFSYSYQCSTAWVTSYAQVFVNMSLISCAVSPVLLVAVRYLVDRKWLSSELGASVLPALMQTSQERQIRRDKKKGRDAPLSYRVVDTQALFLDLLQDLLILNTFGLVVPMCGLTVTVALVVKMLQYHYALEHFRDTQPAKDVKDLSEDCLKFLLHSHPFLKVVVFLVGFSSVFLSGFLFDTMGDAKGWFGGRWESSVWAPVLMWGAPLFLVLIARLLLYDRILLAPHQVPQEGEGAASESSGLKLGAHESGSADSRSVVMLNDPEDEHREINYANSWENGCASVIVGGACCVLPGLKDVRALTSGV